MTTKRFAILENQVVTNIAISYTALSSAWIDLSGISPEPSTGWMYSNGVFTAPVVEVPVVPTKRHISVGAFFDRFKQHKYQILASTDATIKALILDSSVRKYIDLDNPELPFGLGLVVNAGFAIDVAAILGDSITPLELP